MIVFVHIEKTAGTTFKFILRNSFGIHHLDANKLKTRIFTIEDLQFARRVFPGIRAVSGHNIVEPSKHLEGTEYFLATFLRDPVNRCLSHYQDRVLRRDLRQPFSEWILDEKQQNLMVKRIAGSADLNLAKELLLNKYDFVGITEEFDKSLKLLKLLSPYPMNFGYKRKVVASDNSVKQKLMDDPEVMKLVRRYNDQDMQLYEFAVNRIFHPAIVKMRSALDITELPGEVYRNSIRCSYRLSTGYNKFVFRPLVKLLRVK